MQLPRVLLLQNATFSFLSLFRYPHKVHYFTTPQAGARSPQHNSDWTTRTRQPPFKKISVLPLHITEFHLHFHHFVAKQTSAIDSHKLLPLVQPDKDFLIEYTRNTSTLKMGYSSKQDHSDNTLTMHIFSLFSGQSSVSAVRLEGNYFW